LLHDAVGRDLLARAYDEPLPDGELLDRDAGLAPAVVENGDILGAELEQRLQRGAGAALGARLEEAAQQNEGGHDGRDFEVRREAARSSVVARFAELRVSRSLR
jgi:hypothetical protein